ncbi:hypothetical protein BB560_002752 [Smittium megazygosporum]|uniref:Protein kinase domain-containing protein n=1 Tax=Smittium megazygosporum TaxID=133381 RepID=A0A2T9ZDU5_9FUNG|nr:hypothetical protein BB560_002752 [Smittium megazygosporum]
MNSSINSVSQVCEIDQLAQLTLGLSDLYKQIEITKIRSQMPKSRIDSSFIKETTSVRTNRDSNLNNTAQSMFVNGTNFERKSGPISKENVICENNSLYEDNSLKFKKARQNRNYANLNTFDPVPKPSFLAKASSKIKSLTQSQFPLDSSREHGIIKRKDTRQSYVFQSQALSCIGSRYFIMNKIGSGRFCDVFLAFDAYSKPIVFKQGIDEYRLFVIKIMKTGENAIGISEHFILRGLHKLDNYIIQRHVCKSVRLLKTVNTSELLGLEYSDGDESRWSIAVVMNPLIGLSLLKSLELKLGRIYSDAPDPYVYQYQKIKLICALSKQILFALNEIHAAGVVHADLKPENIMLESKDSDCLKLIDFGNAVKLKNLYHYFRDFNIQPVWYRAPEVACRCEFGEKIDLWSVGCIICEMITHKPLFSSFNNYGLICEIVKLRGPIPLSMSSSVDFSYNPSLRENSLMKQPNIQGLSANKDLFSKTPHEEIKRQRNLAIRLNIDCPEALSLIDKLLTLDPLERINAKEALDHPFFIKY